MGSYFSSQRYKKRITPIIKKKKKGTNKPLNRYLEHNIIRLDSKRSNSVLYWKIAQILMKRSNVFRVSAFNQVFHNWHRKLPLKLQQKGISNN